MQHTIILATVLNIFATANPDLCGYVYEDSNGLPYTDALGQTFSRYCAWTNEQAPLLDLDVCCVIIDYEDAACVLPDARGRCDAGWSAMSCEYGEVISSTGEVACYQPFGSICELGFCEHEVLPPAMGPVEDATCCYSGGSCNEIETADDVLDCHDWGGYVGWCEYGAQNDDGTIDCFD